MISPESGPLLVLRPRWSVAIRGALLTSVLTGVVAGLVSRRWWLGLIAAVVALAVTSRTVRRRSLAVDANGFIAQRDSYRLVGQWVNVTGVHRRRIGLVVVDELLLADARTQPVGVGGKTRSTVPAKVAEIGADRRLQVGVYDARWRTGPIGQALTRHGLDVSAAPDPSP